MDLQGKTAIVTGAAHRVGKGIALSLARKGCNIVLHYGNSKDEALRTQHQIEELGVEAHLYSVDLNDLSAIKQFISELDVSMDYQILVNSAGSFVKRPLLETDMGDWDTAFNINARAPLLLTQFVNNKLSTADDSLIVNIGDLSGIEPWQSFGVHGMSKASLLHLTKIAARELAPIRVNAIVPGPILPPPEMSEDHPRWKEMINQLPLKVSGSPDNVGQTVVFLAENKFVTGSIIHVDGGESLIGPANH